MFLERLGRRWWRFPRPFSKRDSSVLISPRRASLMASPLGNTEATSGSISTKFVPAVARLKYFPRTGLGKVVKSYSGLNSFARFFVDIFLSSGGFASTDQTNRFFSFVRVRHHQKPLSSRHTQGDKPLFVCRVVGVVETSAQTDQGKRWPPHQRISHAFVRCSSPSPRPTHRSLEDCNVSN